MTSTDKKEEARQLFAQRFRLALNELGFSPNNQKAMKELFGVSGQAARKWAEGQALPTPARLPQIAEILGVRRAWLLDGEGPMRPAVCRVEEDKSSYMNTSPELSISTEELELLRHYRALTAKQRKVVQSLLSLLLESQPAT